MQRRKALCPQALELLAEMEQVAMDVNILKLTAEDGELSAAQVALRMRALQTHVEGVVKMADAFAKISAR